MSGDLLRRAAAKLRESATAAIHDERQTWEHGLTKGGPISGKASPVVVDDRESPSVLIEAWARRYEAVNDYIRTMHPPVALALADWLDSEAALLDFLGENARQHGVAVARAVLREDGEPA